MNKVLLLTQARHGSTYFIDNLFKKGNIEQFYMEYELFKEFYLQDQDGLLGFVKRHSLVNFEFEIIQLKKLRKTNEKEYFNTIFKMLEKNAKEYNTKNYGFKIFPSHVYGMIGNNKINLQEIISFVDKIIILDRDDIEFAYSFANAIVTNKWSISQRHEKKRVILNNEQINNIINQIKLKKRFFEEAKQIIKETNKDCLYLHYNNLGKSYKDINKFLNIDLKTWIPFEKRKYDYESFLKDNPTLLNFFYKI
jgi:hypothetical protein